MPTQSSSLLLAIAPPGHSSFQASSVLSILFLCVAGSSSSSSRRRKNGPFLLLLFSLPLLLFLQGLSLLASASFPPYFPLGKGRKRREKVAPLSLGLSVGRSVVERWVHGERRTKSRFCPSSLLGAGECLLFSFLLFLPPARFLSERSVPLLAQCVCMYRSRE